MFWTVKTNHPELDMDEDATPFLPHEIHDITISKTDENTFKIIFGTKTDIDGLYEGFAEVEIDREILQCFVDRASEALG